MSFNQIFISINLFLTSNDLQWPLMAFEVRVKDPMLYLGLIWVCIRKMAYFGEVVKAWYEKNLNFAIFQTKMVRNEGRGSLENGDM